MQIFETVSPARSDTADVTWLDVIDPALGLQWGQAAEASLDDVDRVVTAARRAFATVWRQVGPADRGRLLLAWAQVIEARADDLIELDMRDTGNLRLEVAADLRGALNWLRYYAAMADKVEGRTLPSGDERLAYTVREPFGVVVGINAYNGNMPMFAQKAGPALAAGNVFILKAPELAPTASMRMAEYALEAGIPPGVVSVVTGRGDVTGAALARHPGVDRLAFTGSAATAEAISAQAAPNLTPLSFELGGKNAVIALADVDASLFVPSLLHSNLVKSGQSCAAGSRIYVHASRYDEIATTLARRAAEIRVGLPGAEGSQMGSLISFAHRDRVTAMVDQGVAEGAELLTGGEAVVGELANGAFYQPTVVTGLGDENVLAREEVFGPVIGIMRYDDLDEAITRANAVEYGLSAQVWGDKASEIQHAAKRLDAGTVWVNMYRGVHWTAPYGGFKRSGYGREGGFEGIEMYTQIKTVMWDLTGAGRSLAYNER